MKKRGSDASPLDLDLVNTFRRSSFLSIDTGIELFGYQRADMKLLYNCGIYPSVTITVRAILNSSLVDYTNSILHNLSTRKYQYNYVYYDYDSFKKEKQANQGATYLFQFILIYCTE